MIVRPNKTLVSRDVYEKKAQRWKSEWPMLEVIPWDGMPHEPLKAPSFHKPL
jgi:hypothetical protein